MAKGKRASPAGDRLSFLTRTFDRLVETGFRALAASVSGISVGWFLTVSAHVVQTPVDLYVAMIGTSLMAISSIFMVCAIAKVVFMNRALPETIGSLPAPPQLSSSAVPGGQEIPLANRDPISGVGRS